MENHLTTVGRNNAHWIVDAILGTGATGELRPPLTRLVELINVAVNKDGKLHRMAIDVPTGLDCDTGRVQSVAVKADVTCTFINQKVGFSSADAAPFLGHISVIGIGAPDFDVKKNGES